MLLLLAQAAFAECPSTFTPDQVLANVVAGEAAFQAGDASALSDAVVLTRFQVGCLSAPLGLNDTGSIYRLWAMDAFVARDKDAARAYLAIAKDLQPDYVFSPVVVPEFHPLRAMYDEIEPEPVATKLLELPKGHSARVNGIESVVVPVGQPFLLQQLDASGAVVLAALVGPNDAVPVMAGMEKEPYGWGLSVLGSARGWVHDGRATLAVGPAVRVDLPIVAGLGADVLVTAGLSVVKEGVVLVPDLRVGVRWEVDGNPRPRFGAAGLFASHAYAPVAPGGALTVGLRLGGLDVDGMFGYAGGVTGGVAVGRAFR
ncbi:MAG: hypothetical protein H6737_09640 [Alphaproteobacteria bacterium]|nr:hypothetical protein [Alphaproteobacteria bacterium]